jgi:Carboxypeptidase regulatory-like domain
VTARHHLFTSILGLLACAGVAVGCSTPVRVDTGGSHRTTTTVVVASGVVGRVTAGPTCPVERPDKACPPRPVSAEIDVHDRNGRTVAKTKSSADGRYRIGVTPGNYTLVVVTSTFPRCPETSISVKAGVFARVDISCDTGIR